MAKDIVYDRRFLDSIARGADLLADSVKITLGPRGRNALLDCGKEGTLLLNDGATIAAEIELKDKTENMAVRILNLAARNTNKLAGDGTTTAIVLAQAMLHEGARNIAAGANPMVIRRGMEKACASVRAALERAAVPVNGRDAVARVAAVSSEDPVLGGMVADALEELGPDALVIVNENSRTEPLLEIAKGMRYERTVVAKELVKKSDGRAIHFQDPLILMTDYEIKRAAELVPLLETVMNRHRSRQLLIIADRLEGEALAALVLNRKKGVLDAVAIRSPEMGDYRVDLMSDLAVFTGATYIQKDIYSLKEVTEDMLGSAESVTIDPRQTLITGGGGDPVLIEHRKNELRRLDRATTDKLKHKHYRERLSLLSGGVARIDAGGESETEINERRLRVEDAVNAAKAAMSEGVVPGGGLALLTAAKSAAEELSGLEDDELTGARIVLNACSRPAWQIAFNAGFVPEEAVARMTSGDGRTGLDADTGNYVDMMEEGIFDPLTVTRSALECAVSSASELLTGSAGVVPAD